MNTIPVFQARHVLPFLGYCRREGLAAAPSMRKFKLPEELCNKDNIYLPQMAAYSAIDHIGQREGVTDIAPRALSGVAIADYGDTISNCVVSAPTLYVAIQQLQRVVKIEDPSMVITVRIDGDSAYLCARSDNAEFQCNAWSKLMLLLNTVKAFAGSQWQTKHITLSSPKLPGFDSRDYFPEARTFWSAGQVSVSFPTALLGSPPEKDNSCAVDRKSPLSLQGAIKGLISAYLSSESIKLETIAEMAQINPRTLQRHLAQLELSFSELVDQVRFERASKLLRESDLKALDIAFEVGFTDPSHFSRAFRRVAGISPRQYRRQQRQG